MFVAAMLTSTPPNYPFARQGNLRRRTRAVDHLRRTQGASKTHTGCLLGAGVAVLGSAGFRTEGFWVRLRVYK